MLMRREDPLTHATQWNLPLASAHGGDDLTDYRNAVRRWTDYLADRHIDAIGYGAIVQQHQPGAGRVLRHDEVRAGSGSASRHILRVFAAAAQLAAEASTGAGGGPELPERTCAIPAEARMDGTFVPADTGWTQGAAELRLTEGLGIRADLDPVMTEIVLAVTSGMGVDAAADAAAERMGLPEPKRQDLRASARAMVLELVGLGLLEFARPDRGAARRRAPRAPDAHPGQWGHDLPVTTDRLLPASLSPERIRDLLAVVRGGGAPVEVVMPFTGKTWLELPSATPADLDAAVAEARVAQLAWAATDPAERAAVLLRLHDAVLDHADALMDVIQAETGKARAHAFEEIADVANACRYYGRTAPAVLTAQKRTGAFPLLTRTTERRHPLGVVGLITPWNYPFTLGVGDAAPGAGRRECRTAQARLPDGAHHAGRSGTGGRCGAAAGALASGGRRRIGGGAAGHRPVGPRVVHRFDGHRTGGRPAGR